MPRSMLLTVALLAATALGACAPSPDANTVVIASDFHTATVPDTADYDALLADAATLPEEERLARRAWVADETARWQEFAGIAETRRRRLERPFLYEGVVPDRRRFLVGVADAVVALEACVQADPAWVEAWSELGHLRLEYGDRTEARACLERSLAAAEAVGPAAAATMLRTHRDLGWTLRELAYWEEGLAAVDAGLTEFRGDEDLLLVKGLLLAGAGRFEDATQLAVRLPKRHIRYFDTRNDTEREREDNWAKQWIKSQARLALGNPAGAYRELNEEPDDERVDIHDLAGQGWKLGFAAYFDHRHRFWNDLGLVAELLDDPSSLDFYVAAFRQRELAAYYPAAPDIRSPLVMGVPDGISPSVTSFAHGHYVVGSPWSYVALQMDLMALALFPGQRDRAAAEALDLLDVLERRDLRPAAGHALRGRVLYRQEKYPEARGHLAAARDSFAVAGDVDARTSLFMGLIDLAAQDFTSAAGLLEEAARADTAAAVTWRMLGVAYANLDRTGDALAVMDKAVSMEPRSLAGYYNRGLLKLQIRRCSGAALDLDRALRLAPDNEEVRRLLQVAAACVRAGESGDEAIVPTVRPGGADAAAFTPGTDLLLDHLAADLEDFFAVRTDTAAADSVDVYASRTARAVACLDRADPVGARDLLTDYWGENLTPLEEVVLLEAEWRLGEDERLSGLVEDALAGEVTTTNPYVWTLMLREVRGDPARYGAAAEDRLVARLLDHSAEFSGRTVREWAQALRRELEESRGTTASTLSEG